MLFDIVIPLGPNERKNICKQIEYTKRNVIGYRNIYIITGNTNDLDIKDCKIINENIFPFKMNDIANYFIQYRGKHNRNGWYLQQLLKLYASFVIDDLLDNYLVIDADVFFLKPINFIFENKYIFTISDENHEPYFKHMKRLHSSFEKQINFSGISHHMIFNKQILSKLFYSVEEKHKCPFWVAFIQMVDEHKKYNIDFVESGASEYELYFNYMLLHHKENLILRKLNWCNKSYNYLINENDNYDYVSLCAWMIL